MYSPGPVNFMGLNSGLTGQLKKTIGFYLGIGFAMLILFVLFGYIGEAVIPHGLIHYIALAGAIYTFYLAIKMIRANVETTQQQESHLTFLNGLFIQ